MRLLTLIALLLFALPSAAGTYYVAANGVDTNNGTTKTTPWLHAPGMTGATGNPAAHRTACGDQYILRGGDTWGATNWPWSLDNGASPCAGTAVYVGVDLTWYTGGSFARPILSGGGTYPGTGTSPFVNAGYVGNHVLDNFEFTGAYVNQSSTNVTYVLCNTSTYNFHAE